MCSIPSITHFNTFIILSLSILSFVLRNKNKILEKMCYIALYTFLRLHVTVFFVNYILFNDFSRRFEIHQFHQSYFFRHFRIIYQSQNKISRWNILINFENELIKSQFFLKISLKMKNTRLNCNYHDHLETKRWVSRE